MATATLRSPQFSAPAKAPRASAQRNAPAPAADLNARLSLLFTTALLRTPAGRAHLLAQSADAEATGESRIFDQALLRVDDPELQKMIGRHRADELRHEQLFRDRLRQTAAPEPTVPAELKLVDRIDRALGGILERPITDDRGVLEAYSLLQALEERAVTQFPIFAAAMSESDPDSATVFRDVLEDEKRHLLYCTAVARRYAKSEEERLEVLQKMRDAETRAFAQNQLANMDLVVERGLVRGPAVVAWKAVRVLAGWLRPMPRTPFWGQA